MLVECVEEHAPLGTIGGVALVKDKLRDGAFVVTNGDIVTDLNIREMLSFHRSHGGAATVATYWLKHRNKYGVVERVRGSTRVKQFIEKPVQESLVNMGVYILNPEVLDLIPENVPFGVDDLLQTILGNEDEIHYWVHRGLWLDIGNVRDLQEAQSIFESKRAELTAD